MKTHARVVVLKTGENRRKHGFERGKVFRKNQKKRAKKIFPVVLHDSTAPRQHRTPIDSVHQKRHSIENYIAECLTMQEVVNRHGVYFLKV